MELTNAPISVFLAIIAVVIFGIYWLRNMLRVKPPPEPTYLELLKRQRLTAQEQMLANETAAKHHAALATGNRQQIAWCDAEITKEEQRGRETPSARPRAGLAKAAVVDGSKPQRLSSGEPDAPAL